MSPFLVVLISLAAFAVIVVFIVKLTGKYKSKRLTKREIETNSFVDIIPKFLMQKEYKVLKIIKSALPTGYVVFPKIGVDTILEPLGKNSFFLEVKDKYIDAVIFDENTMQPVIAVDIFDNTPGDFPIEGEEPLVVEALQMVSIPLVSILVKPDYTDEDIKAPIYKVLYPGANKSDTTIDA